MFAVVDGNIKKVYEVPFNKKVLGLCIKSFFGYKELKSEAEVKKCHENNTKIFYVCE